MHNGFTFLENAERDIEQIERYISRDNPQAAAGFRVALQRACDTLVTLPEMGRIYGFEKAELEDLRMIRLQKFEKYLIFYRPNQKETILEIVRILHGARDLPALFGENDDVQEVYTSGE